MDLQSQRCRGDRLLAFVGSAFITIGCVAVTPHGVARYTRVDAPPEMPFMCVFASPHFSLHTTLVESSRVAPIVATLEAAFVHYQTVAGVRGDNGVPMDVYVFAGRTEWEAFTRRRMRSAAPLYLKIDRGGYTADTFCAVRDQGEHATLSVLAHEGFHLFIATRFDARPPPFIEEGMATLFENVSDEGDDIRLHVGQNAARVARLAALLEAGVPLPPLRQMLTMHAGDVVVDGPRAADAFYAHAWAFVRYLRESGDAKLSTGLARLMRDAAAGALSSASLPDDPALVERYLGRPLESLDVPFRKFAERVAANPREP